jgi:SLOG cluster4 family
MPARYVIAIVVDVEYDQRFPKPSIIFAVSADELDIVADHCCKEHVVGLRVRSADGQVMIAPVAAVTRNPARRRLATRQRGPCAADRPVDENRPIRRPYIAVIGSGEATEVEASLAGRLGVLLADADAFVIAGGLGGVMRAR